MTSVAIVGAGPAGLACWSVLAAAGIKADLFDKGRGPGGRASTRRGESGAQFDHGLQYIRTQDPSFQSQIDLWVSEGRLAPWSGRFGRVTRSGFEMDQDGPQRFVGVPKMNELLKPDTGPDAGNVQFGVQIAEVTGGPGDWILTDDAGQTYGPYAKVAIGVPAPQAVAMLAPASDLQLRASAAVYAPCWTLMVALETRLDLPFDGAVVEGSPVSWLARDSAKPGRNAGGETGLECWVAQASADWSREHLEMDREEACDALLGAFAELAKTLGIGGAITPVIRAAHRWRYANVEVPAGSPCLWDGALGLGACGDWCLGPRVEAAWTSGRSLGQTIADAGP